MSRLTLPAMKTFIDDLQRLEQKQNSTGIANLCQWDGVLCGRRTTVDIVCIQGNITSVQDTERFCINDQTAVAAVTNQAGVPQGCQPVQEGNYMMVIGEVLSSGETPLIKAMKIQDLTKDTMAKHMWPAEVKDLHNFLKL